MFKKCLLITIAGFILAFPALVLAEKVELSYDDGSPHGGCYYPDQGAAYAVKFTPPAGTWYVTTARYYIYSQPGSLIKVRVLHASGGEPASDMFEGLEIRPDATGWFNVDLNEYEIEVTDEFFVVYEFAESDPFNTRLGHDTEGNERSWNHSPSSDWSLNEHTTYFIRAVVVDELGVEKELLPESSMDCRCYPNPFTASTQIDYVLPQAGRVTLTVWDAGGRCVRILVDACKPQGNHSIRWDGKDEAGNPLPSGVYFSRLDADYSTLTQRIVLIR
jgi:hypothetical protein